jgi:hypothetical protein
MNEDMDSFIDEETLRLSIEGAFQRANIYKDNVADDKKLESRYKLKERLKKISLYYKDKLVTEEQHISHLENLMGEMTAEFKDILSGNEFRAGIAQKALNLYLKYLWCFGKITEPPHCPFDSRILSEIDRNDIKWTEMKGIDKYKSVVESAKQFAGEEPLAEWELRKYNSPPNHKLPD